MITIERVGEVFGFTPGPWYDHKDRTLHDYGWIGDKSYGGIFIAETAHSEGIASDRLLISKSPELLHGLIQVALEFDPPMRDRTGSMHYIAVVLIESCDRQGRKWEILKKELLSG